jgi:hypothetical protein
VERIIGRRKRVLVAGELGGELGKERTIGVPKSNV